MASTKSTESPAQEKKLGEKMKKHSAAAAENKEEGVELKLSKKIKEQENKEEGVELKLSKKIKEQEKQHHSFNASTKPPSAPTLQDSFNNSFSEGDLQMVVASHSLSSLSDIVGAIKVVKEENKNGDDKSVVAVMNVEEDDVEAEDDDGVYSKKEGKWYIVLLLGLRIAAFVFCKIAFSVLASDRRKKVRRASSSNDDDFYPFPSFSIEDSQTHWYEFEEFKYLLSVDIIGFVYSGLQIGDIVKYMITKRHTVDPKLRGYFNFAMDQALAYLVMSAASSSATIASYWAHDAPAADKYLEMAKASVALSFVAFAAFASSSVVSAFIFCRFN